MEDNMLMIRENAYSGKNIKKKKCPIGLVFSIRSSILCRACVIPKG